MHTSTIIWVTLAAFFVGGVYLAGHMLKPKKSLYTGATFAQKHITFLALLTVIVPISIGVLLVNTVFSSRPVIKKKEVTSVPVKPSVYVAEPEPVLKMIISDGSKEVDIAALNLCKSDEVTIIENQLIVCKTANSTKVKTWLTDVRLQERRILKKYIAHQRALQEYKVIDGPSTTVNTSDKLDHIPKIMIQGFSWNSLAPKIASTSKVVQEKKPFKDRYAEVFFFLALVAGVLSKYFWDFYEERRHGEESTFEPHVIVMSFIISALVYYSIQQGLENEAGKLTTRGILFAFNNGFMWQTILKSTRLSGGPTDATAKANEQPS